MITGLRALQAAACFELEVVDVDHDPALEARYGDLVPVLAGAGSVLCHYHLDLAKVNDYLSKVG